MNNNENKYGMSVKYLEAVFIILLILYFGKILFIPFFFGLLFALLTYPMCVKLERKGIPRSLAIGTLMIVVVLIFTALLWMIGYEMNVFVDGFPRISQKMHQFSPSFSGWLESKFGYSIKMQNNSWERVLGNLENSITGYLRNALNTTVSTVFMLVMTPIYAALFLYHRATFVNFLKSILNEKYKTKLPFILNECITVYFSYVKGTFFVYCIVGILNSIALLALGIEYAILYGMLTSFMMIVPYVGIFISAALPVSAALITKDSAWYPIGVIAIFSFIQYLESNVIFPRIVGKQLNLSTMATLVAIMIGTVLWGIAGMILFTPFAAILKIISDYVEEWKPLNLLLNREYDYNAKRKEGKFGIPES